MPKQVGKIVNPVYPLTLFGPMEFPINLDTDKSRCFIVYIEGLQVIISKT